jgi:predicted esterase
LNNASTAITNKLEALGYKLHFIDGPIVLTKADLPPSFQTLSPENDGAAPKLRSWWVVNKSKPAEHYNLDRAFAAIDEFTAQHGPFVGVIGFSQGASLTALLASRLVTQQQQKDATTALKFAILISGFVPNYKPLISTYFSHPVALASLHVIGASDTVVPPARSRDLAAKFDTNRASLISHPHDHIIPNDAETVDRIAAFVAEHGAAGGPAKL